MFKVKTKEIRKQIRFFQDCGYKVLIPVKSFSNSKLISYFKNDVDGFDISNLTEAKLIPSGRRDYLISAFSSVTEDVRDLVPKLKPYPEATFSLHSLDQIQKLSLKAPYLIRINPYSSLSKSNQSLSRFGLDWSDLRSLDRRFFESEYFRGFSTQFGLFPHTFRQKMIFLKSLQRFCKEKNIHPRILNLGGGWGLLESKEIRQISALTLKLFGISPWCEPGRALFKNAIEASSIITDESRRKNELFLHIGYSFLAHFRWSFPEIEIAGLKISYAKTLLYSKELWICGSTCCETDRIGPLWISEAAFKKSWIHKKITLKDLDGYCLGWNHSFNGQQALRIEIK